MSEHESQETPKKTFPDPMWEAMDCPDVTDDPFYDDFD